LSESARKLTRPPALIILNGASSSGKTLTAQALAQRLGPECVVTGLDDILERAQPFGPDSRGGLRRQLKIAWFQITDGRLRLFKTLHREVVTLHQSGRAVVMETALMDERALLDAAVCFAAHGGLFVALKPPLAVSEQWEAQRGDRPLGQARQHYALIHAHGIYDLVLDPSQRTPAECAEAIFQRWDSAPPEAFRKLIEGGAKQIIVPCHRH